MARIVSTLLGAILGAAVIGPIGWQTGILIEWFDDVEKQQGPAPYGDWESAISGMIGLAIGGVAGLVLGGCLGRWLLGQYRAARDSA